jgi:hypothetical protein
LAEICLKTVERTQLNFRHDFGRIRPSWPKFDPWLVFTVPICVKFGQFGKISANLDDIRPKSEVEIQLRAFDRF